MDLTAVEKIADAVLYEGYNLYPYRPSSVKNQMRWTFGCLFPPSYCAAANDAERSTITTEFLIVGDPSTEVSIKARFLQLTARKVGRSGSPIQWVDELRVGDRIWQSWQEATERSIEKHGLKLDELTSKPSAELFRFKSRHEEEPIRSSDGKQVGMVRHERQRLAIVLSVQATRLRDNVAKLTIRVENRTAMPDVTTRDEALSYAQVGTHVIVAAKEGELVSLTDPPEPYRDLAAECRNDGAWPVLIGEPGRRDLLLAAPIILEDYPSIAPESTGDYFDGAEIDEMLALRIQTLTDEEKRAMSAVDERTRLLLDRAERMTDEQMLQLHGRSEVGFRPGQRVRLRPKGRSDAFDVVLAGKIAVVTSIEQDFEDQSYVCVVVEDDPGQDLGIAGKPGHRFYFRLDEVEPLAHGE